jgi:tripartite-type tricarboxylate transporter receptor subunit TctC
MIRSAKAPAVYALLAGLLAVAAALPARGEEYPSKPIRLIVTTPPGGLVDVLGRLLAQALGARLGQNVVVENRAGATTQIGVDMTVRAPPDGYVLLIGTSELTMLPALKKSVPYDPAKDFTPVALTASSWTVFAINPKVPATNLTEFIAYAKAHPGTISYGSNGVGGSLHIAVELLQMQTGIKLVHVPYRGGAQAATDAMAGQIEMVSMGLASTRSTEGRLRLLAQTGPNRHPMLPDVPTTAEFGLPEVRMETWFGILGPAKLPADIVARLAREIEPILQDPTIKERLFALGCQPAWLPPEKFAGFMAAETRKWAKIIPAIGITPED